MQKEAWVLEQDLPNCHVRLHRLSRGCFQMANHSHDVWQVIVVTDGMLEIRANGESFMLCPGMIHILPPGEGHSLESTEGYSQLGIDLRGKDKCPLLNLLTSCIPTAVSFPVQESLEICRRIDNHYDANRSLLSQMRIWNLVESLILCSIEKADGSHSDRWAEELTDFLDLNLDKPLALGDIAAHFYMSVPQLERKCRRAYHCGAAAWLQQCRVHRAKQLLINTDDSVLQIGAAVGYPDPSHFSGFFRKHTGLSPRAFRREYQQYA